jgi:hypothetical protein
MGRRDRSRAQRVLGCMGCAAAEIEKKHGRMRADTAVCQGLALAECYDVQRVFEGLCPTHRNTYRLMRDAIDNQADADKQAKEAVDLAIARAAAEGRGQSS